MNDRGVWPRFDQEGSDRVLREDPDFGDGFEGSDLTRVRNGPARHGTILVKHWYALGVHTLFKGSTVRYARSAMLALGHATCVALYLKSSRDLALS